RSPRLSRCDSLRSPTGSRPAGARPASPQGATGSARQDPRRANRARSRSQRSAMRPGRARLVVTTCSRSSLSPRNLDLLGRRDAESRQHRSTLSLARSGLDDLVDSLREPKLDLRLENPSQDELRVTSSYEDARTAVAIGESEFEPVESGHSDGERDGLAGRDPNGRVRESEISNGGSELDREPILARRDVTVVDRSGFDTRLPVLDELPRWRVEGPEPRVDPPERRTIFE